MKHNLVARMNCKTFIGLIILLILTKNCQSLSLFKNIGKALTNNANEPSDIFTKNVFPAMDLVSGEVGKMIRPIPGLSSLLNLSLQMMEGLPLQIALKLLSEVCGALMNTGMYQALKTPDIKKLNFILITPTANYYFPLTEAEQMWNSPHFNKTKKVVIFASGWLTNMRESASTIVSMKNAYLCRNDANFIVVDSAKYLDTLYSWAAYNTEAVGRYIAIELAQLIKYVPVDKIHLIGHSLGAHIVGAAGRRFTELTGTSIPRITGLDPANPCFGNGFRLTGIQKTDATFVDIIHTDVGILGKRDPMGDIDSYAGGLQPIAYGSLTFGGSHVRAVSYYAESVYPGNENNFIAVKCSSMSALEDLDCHGSIVAVGYATPNTSQGIYFFDVNGSSPYGKGNSATNSTANMKCAQRS